MTKRDQDHMCISENILMSALFFFFSPAIITTVFPVICHSEDRFKFFHFLSLSQQDIIGQVTGWCKLK